MASNIKKIITFGDSFTAGDELLQDTYMEEILEMLKSHSHIKVSKSGKLESKHSINKFQQELSAFMKDKCGDKWTEYDRQFEYTYSSLLAKRLGVEVVNYSRGGNSNLGIYDNVVNCIETIDSSTLLLIGSTFINRKTRWWPQAQSKNWSGIHKHLYNYKTYLPGWGLRHKSDIDRAPAHKKYVALDLEFGDDWYFSYLSFTAQLLALKAELTSKNIPHYFIDTTGTHNSATTNNFSDLEFDSSTKKQQEYIQKTIASVLLPVSLLDSASSSNRAGLKHSQLFGHFSREAHKQYANYLFDIVTRANIV